MGNITLLVAAIVFACILVYMFFKLKESDNDGEGDVGSAVIRLLIISLLVGSILVIGKVALDDYNNCAWLVSNSTVSGSVTSYGYDYTCSVNSNNTAQIFYQVLLWFARFIGIYLFFYIVIAAYKAISGVLGKGR